MTPIARPLATPFAVGLAALVANAAVAAESATIRHDVRLAALALFVAASTRAALKLALLLRPRRAKRTMPDLRYRTPAPRQPRLSLPAQHDVGV